MGKTDDTEQFIPEVRALIDQYKYENSLVLQRNVDKILADASNPFAGFDALVRFLCDEIAYLRTEVTLHRLLDTGSLTLTLPNMAAGDKFPDARKNAPSAVSVWLGTSFDGRNWYNAEWLDDAKRALRWSGPGHTASVNIFLNRQRNLIAEWEIHAIFDGATTLDQLVVTLNDEDMPTLCEAWDASGKAGRVWAVLPAIVDERSHYCSIGIKTPAVGCPRDVDPNSQDSRMLGVAASDMRVYPE